MAGVHAQAQVRLDAGVEADVAGLAGKLGGLGRAVELALSTSLAAS